MDYLQYNHSSVQIKSNQFICSCIHRLYSVYKIHIHIKEAAGCHRVQASYVKPDTSRLRKNELSYCRESRPLHLFVTGRQTTSIHSCT